SEEPVRMQLRVRGEGTATAGDIQAPPEVEVLNTDLYLFTADSDDVDLDIEFIVEQDQGYLPAQGRERMPIGELPVDATFSPIRKVAFSVDRARVGQMTNYDRLTLEIWSDGRVAPFDALKEASRILITHLRLIAGLTLEEEETPEEETGIPSRIYDVPLEELKLSVRVFNALRRAGIANVGEVLEMLTSGDDALLTIRNFGQTSLAELKGALGEHGFLADLEAAQQAGGD
ncbi:MAG: DNA-directed RNA polymerase subunit alpha, partial [Anaerolineales bacterium]